MNKKMEKADNKVSFHIRTSNNYRSILDWLNRTEVKSITSNMEWQLEGKELKSMEIMNIACNELLESGQFIREQNHWMDYLSYCEDIQDLIPFGSDKSAKRSTIFIKSELEA